jgi:hypothetical protein
MLQPRSKGTDIDAGGLKRTLECVEDDAVRAVAYGVHILREVESQNSAITTEDEGIERHRGEWKEDTHYLPSIL